MAGGDAAIQAALYEHLKRLDLPKALPIAPEGKNFDAKGKAYLRPTYLPGETAGFGTESDGDVIYAGLFQVDVFVPVNGGIADPLRTASAISVHFRRGTKLPTDEFLVRIDAPPSILPAQQEPAWFHVPVRIRWIAYAPAS